MNKKISGHSKNDEENANAFIPSWLRSTPFVFVCTTSIQFVLLGIFSRHQHYHHHHHHHHYCIPSLCRSRRLHLWPLFFLHPVSARRCTDAFLRDLIITTRQRSFGEVMFSLVFVCLFTGLGGSPCENYPWYIRSHYTGPLDMWPLPVHLTVPPASDIGPPISTDIWWQKHLTHGWQASTTHPPFFILADSS